MYLIGEPFLEKFHTPGLIPSQLVGIPAGVKLWAVIERNCVQTVGGADFELFAHFFALVQHFEDLLAATARTVRTQHVRQHKLSIFSFLLSYKKFDY